MSKLLKSSAVYVLLGFLPVAINFLLAPVYTAVLPPVEYAIIGISTLFQTFLTFFLSFSLDGALTRIYFDYKTKEEQRNLLGTLIIATSVISAAVFLLLLFFGNAIFTVAFKSPDFTFTRLGIWVFLTTFAQVIYLLFLGFYRNEENLKAYSFWSIVFFVLPVLGILAGLLFFRSGPSGAIIGRGIGSLLTVVGMLIHFYRRRAPKFVSSYLRVSLKYSLPLIPYQIMFAAFSNIDRIILERFFLQHEFGVYNFAAMVSGLVPIFMNSMANALNPRIYKSLSGSTQSEEVRILNQLNLLGTAFVICCCIALVVPAMRIFISGSYSGSYPYVGLLFLAYLPYTHYLVYTVPLFYFGRTRSFPVISFVALVTGVLFNLVFLRYLGIWSVCISLFVIRVMQLAVARFFTRRYDYAILGYIKQKKNILSSLVITSCYALILYFNYRFGLLPVDVVNLVPLLVFALLCSLYYRSEISMVCRNLRPLLQPFLAKLRGHG
ncbi:MAG: hypothetical protein EOO09_00960 [Chitinophagaceae bacterium]|nr:MAG: hypothetical protein EOO09_00960 [Chitinophagaceae bacterium]